MKKLKYILPALSFTPIIGVTALCTACAQKEEDIGVPATKVTITNYADQQEFDIKNTKKLQLEAKVEPKEANQEVTYEILDQEGTGNIACSSTGIIYTNGCVGTITVRAWSKGKKIASDPVELVFWDSDRIIFNDSPEHNRCYVTCDQTKIQTIEDVVVPSSHIGVDAEGKPKEYKVNGLAYGSFNGAEKLSYVRFPKNSEDFNYIGSYSFYQCAALKKISLSDSIRMIDSGAFYGCTGLKTIKMPSKLEIISNEAFNSCLSLENIDFPDTLTYIGTKAFYQCNKIKEFHIHDKVSIIGEGAFSNCWSSSFIISPENKRFELYENMLMTKDHKRVLCWQYKSGKEINKVDIPDEVEQIDQLAFTYSEDLKEIYFSENSKCKSIGEDCFALCTSLSHVHLPDQLKEIKYGTFSYCWNLNGVHLPNELQVIQNDAFYGCDSLETIDFHTFGENIENYRAKNVWIVYNYGISPKAIIQKYQMDPMTTEILEDIPEKIIKSGAYLNPDEPFLWSGGYSNCVWYRSDKFINPEEEEPSKELIDLIAYGPTKDTYKVGEKLDLTGLTVTGVYNDASEEDIPSSKYSTIPEDGIELTKSGDYDIQIIALDKWNIPITTKITITVEN